MPENKSKKRKLYNEFQTETEDMEKKFGVKFKSDIFQIWQWVLENHSHQPLECLLDTLKLRLCGPFRYMARKKDNNLEIVDLHMMDREWQCPPEFQPCFSSDTHLYGLWRDSPEDTPCFVVEKKKNSGIVTSVATDILDFIRCQAKKEKAELPKDLLGMIESRPSPDSLKQIVSKRRKKVVAKTFNKIGIVVPVGRNEVGYRPLSMSYPELDDMLSDSSATDDETEKNKILVPFDECVNYIQFANDECDFGMGFEFGMCVFSHPTSRNFVGTISTMLPLAYKLLGRPLFSQIIKRMCKELKEEGATISQ